jgi:hypothetical protein
LHHFVNVTQPSPRVTYIFECPVTKQLSELSASEGVVESTIPLAEVEVPIVAAPVKYSK